MKYFQLITLLLLSSVACRPTATQTEQSTAIDLSGAIEAIRKTDAVKNALVGFQLLDVQCDSMVPMLSEAYRLDQEVRKTGGDMELVDQKNQQVVISILEKCGFPSAEEAGRQGFDAIFFVMQHSDGGIMGHYYPQIAAAVDRGEITKSAFALMQDRLLMYNGYKQVYGSQIMNDHLYELQAPETVNERRAAVGLEPIETYLQYFNLDYEKELARMKEGLK